VSLTEAGFTEESSAMQTFYEVGATSCASTADNMSARVGSRSIDLRFPDPGNFSYRGQFVADEFGSYLICGYIHYLGDSDQAAPRATASASVSVPEPPPPSVSIRTPSSFTTRVGDATAITANFRVSVSARLRTFVEPGGFSCAATSLDELVRENSQLIGSHDVGRSSTLRQDSYTPAAPGRHQVCSYLEEAEPPYRTDTASSSFVVPRPPPPELRLSASRRVTAGRVLSISVTAQSPAAGRVTLYSDRRACARNAEAESARKASRLISGRAIARYGSADYTKRVRLRKPGRYRLCGYITQADVETTLARASRSVVVRVAR
jgi:hypothetical protein